MASRPGDDDPVTVVRRAELVPAEPATPGMDRRVAFHHDDAWAGTVTTTAGVLTGWHVHPGHDTYVYIESGQGVVEYGPGGTRSHEAGPGDFLRIPKGIIHREGTAAGSDGVRGVLIRVGKGELVVNVDGPEPA